MTWTRRLGFGLSLLLGGTAVQAQSLSPSVVSPVPQTGVITTPTAQSAPPKSMPMGLPAATSVVRMQPVQDIPGAPSGGPAGSTPLPESREAQQAAEESPAPAAPALGPTPATDVGILQGLIFGDCAKESKIKFTGWIDLDYTYRSTGHGENNIAPVMNRFGDEFLARQLGLYIYKPLSKTDWDWGFNALFIAGSDASFLGPTAGWYDNTNPRFGTQFTDLNVTAHIPILTEGGVDLKIGRQTTVLGPMGAIAWQRPLDSSDYAWFNMEEGRYTGVSANWIISKQLSWYNGIEIGGWGVFYDNPARGVDYIGQINYWLDEEAKVTKVWATVLTGPTGFHSNGNTTTVELGVQHNYSKCLYQIVDFQATYSKAPLFFTPPPGYQERAYDVYTYLGYHLNANFDVTSRFEWYKDVDGGGYAGGFGIPHNNYFETTLGVNYHPTKWIEFRPEIRYDHATKDAFGADQNFKNQLSIAGDVLLKF